MEKIYICKNEALCFKAYKSRKSLKRHVRRKHSKSQRPSTPIPPALLNAPSRESTASEWSTHVSRDHEPEMNYQHQIQDKYIVLDEYSAEHDHEPEMKYQHQIKDKYIALDEYSTEPERTVSESRERNRIHSIIIDFFDYWDDARLETRMIDNIALLLIKHSRIANKNDANYLAATNAYSDMLYQTNSLHLQTMYKLIENFIVNVKRGKRDGLFDWNSLVISFTMAHNLLMKYPHLHPDIVNMMLEVFHLAGNDLIMLGGWDDFMIYSKQYFEETHL